MSSSRGDMLRELLMRAIKEVFEQLSYTQMVFHNPSYDLKQTIENDLDFLLAVLAQILDRYGIFCLNRNIKPINEETALINYFLFSRAGEFCEFKEMIRKAIGL
jgi:hypothetical protein